MRKVLFFICLLSTAFSQELSSEIVKNGEPSPPSQTDSRLKAIVLLSSTEDLNPNGYENIAGIEINNVPDLPGSEEDLKEMLRSDFLDRPLTQETISDIKREIIEFYRRNHRPIVTVIAPKQNISSGVLQLIVVEGKVGTVEVYGNRHFSTNRLRRYLDLHPGGRIRSDVVNKDLIFINKNPFRQADLIYKPGQTTGTTDVELVVQDRRTYRFYGGIDNTGNSVTGNNRLIAGFNWGNVFNWDHILSFQFSSSDNFKDFLAYTLHYTIPLPTRHTMSIYGGYSTVDSKFEVPEVVGTKFRNSGYNAQASFRYDVPFNPLYSFLQEFSCGFDFKRMNNNLEFGGLPVFSKNVNLFQLMASYNLGYESKQLIASFEIEGFVSPAHWLPDQSNSTYQTLRPFAKDKYIYVRSSFSFIHRFHPWVYYSLFLRGQGATTNLLPSEEYGVGGYDTVRGYQEREANGDQAFVGNFELTSAPFAFSRCLNIRNGGDQMQLLAFFDYGAAYVHTDSPGQKKNQHLYSFGPGLRYQIQSYVTARLDWGFQLHRITPNTPQQRLHFQFIASY
jgi:hemolysin activation/secretion protein